MTLDTATTHLHPDPVVARLGEHLVAGALVRKAVDDPVPFAVWWTVAEALRASHQGLAADAERAVVAALDALQEHHPRSSRDGHPRGGAVPWHRLPSDPFEVSRAQLLVARLLFSTVATSPTLLEVRLTRLRIACRA